MDALITDSGRCGGEWDAFLACSTGRANVCDAVIPPTPDVREDDSADFLDCYLDYCTANPEKAYCPDV